MDGFCLQSKLDLTLFICYRVVDGILNNRKSLMTENDRDLNDRTPHEIPLETLPSTL